MATKKEKKTLESSTFYTIAWIAALSHEGTVALARRATKLSYMTPWLDARIPVLLGGAIPGPDDAALVEIGAASPPGTPPCTALGQFTPDADHPAGCTCCAARQAAALALDRLFLQRARGEVPFFRRVAAVLATERGEASLRAALASDPVVAARYRLG